MSDTSAVGNSALAGTFTGLAVITVSLRFFARRSQKLPLLADDWLMLPALASYIGAAACVFLAVKKKTVGYSSFQFTPEELAAREVANEKLQIALDILTILCLGCTKASALMFYQRIFCVSGRKATFNIVVTTTVIVVACWVITFEFLTGFQCHTHFSALWDGTYTKYCTYSFPFLYGLAISDFLLDVWVLLLPIPIILRLHTTPTTKLSIIGVFLLACIGLGASIGRLVIFIQIETAGPVALLTKDHEKSITKSLYFIMLEAGMSLVAVNLPSIWLVLTTLAPESILRSVRSIVSLGSRGSKDSNELHHVANADAPKSSTSVASAAPFGEMSGESYAMHDIEQGVHDIPSGQIHVQRSMHLTENLKHEEVWLGNSRNNGSGRLK
ncbi:hypothetical protein PT974_00050 [Cladobotryum mycophilum]|uniref:Rhodopsin domain-containing protein n=1 Tax=Cladobotryum mycophilum TaxID=491253 RepID=A0ABR0T114_9HYPO